MHLATDVQLAVFAPAFTLSQCDSECSRKPPNAHSLSRCLQLQIIKNQHKGGGKRLNRKLKLKELQQARNQKRWREMNFS